MDGISSLIYSGSIWKYLLGKLSYYITGNIYISLLWQVVRNGIEQRNDIMHDWIISEHNAEYYFNRLTEDKNSVFVLLESKNHEQEDIFFCRQSIAFFEKKSFCNSIPEKAYSRVR